MMVLVTGWAKFGLALHELQADVRQTPSDQEQPNHDETTTPATTANPSAAYSRRCGAVARWLLRPLLSYLHEYVKET